MKIGIYGGTFNPPHLGHLTAAAAVIATLKLDKLLLIPASIPPHKALPAGSPTAEQRLETLCQIIVIVHRIHWKNIDPYRVQTLILSER